MQPCRIIFYQQRASPTCQISNESEDEESVHPDDYSSNYYEYDQDGNFEEHPDFPFKIDLYPDAELTFKSGKPASMKEFIGQFEALPSGTKLYSMKAIQNPDDVDGFLLGDIITTDQCVSSYFGDTRMHFRHQW